LAIFSLAIRFLFAYHRNQRDKGVMSQRRLRFTPSGENWGRRFSSFDQAGVRTWL
jgi:hypothetical protein